MSDPSPPEPNALTGSTLDRAADRRRRDEAWLEAQRADPSARVVLLGDAGVRADGDRIALVPMDDVLASIAVAESDHGSELVLLGLDEDGPVYAFDEDAPPPGEGRRPALVGAGGRRWEEPPSMEGRIGLREAAQTLPQEDGALVAYAAGLLNWHRANPHCSICGAPTRSAEGGMLRRCERCRTHHHPRTDPVVIMLVHDGGDRVLLGRQSAWPERRFSTLAGFVSPGESLEEAVAREVLEEVGVQVGHPRYVSSQPWPFPMSLMLGFHVPWTSGEIGGSDDELEDARWFSRAEIVEATGDDSWIAPRPGDGVVLPPRSAIARRLVEGWLAETA